MSSGTSRRKLKSPYEKWHRKLQAFAGKVELDSALVARNEFLRLENMLLRGLFKERLAVPASRMRGRTKVQVSLLSPAQIVKYTRSADGKKYVSMFPKKPGMVRVPLIHLEAMIREVAAEHPKWRKQQIFHEMKKYFPEVPAFRVYDILYDIGFWDGQKNVRGLPWKEFLARFEKVT